MVVAVMVILCDRHGLWPSLSNPYFTYDADVRAGADPDVLSSHPVEQ